MIISHRVYALARTGYPDSVPKFSLCISKNRVPGLGSKIHYPAPNPVNWYPFWHWLR